MSYSVSLSKKAEKFIKTLNSRNARLVYEAIDELALDPFAGGVIKMQGYPHYRKRAGDYRIIYNVDGANVSIDVITIGHRKDVYKDF